MRNSIFKYCKKFRFPFVFLSNSKAKLSFPFPPTLEPLPISPKGSCLTNQLFPFRETRTGAYRKTIANILNATGSLHKQIKNLLKNDTGKLTESLTALDIKINEIENSKSKSKNLNDLLSSFAASFDQLQESDMPPSMNTIKEVNDSSTNLKTLLQTWEKIKAVDISELNKQLKKEGRNELIIK